MLADRAAASSCPTVKSGMMTRSDQRDDAGFRSTRRNVIAKPRGEIVHEIEESVQTTRFAGRCRFR